MNNDFFSLFFSENGSVGDTRAFHFPTDFNYPFDETEYSISSRQIYANTNTFVIHNKYTQDIATSDDGVNWTVNSNLKQLVNYTKFGYGKRYGVIGGTQFQHPLRTSVSPRIFSTEMAIINDKFVVFVPPINDTAITSYTVSKSIYRFPKYVSTNGIDWTEETVQYSNTHQSNSYISMSANWAYYRVDESNPVIFCSGERLNRKNPDNTREDYNTWYGYPSLQVSYDRGDNFQMIDCSDALKNAVTQLVSNDSTLYVQNLTQPMMSAQFSATRYKYHWAANYQKYFLFDLTTRSDIRFSGTPVYNSDGIVYYSTDLVNWNCFPLTAFGGAGRTLNILKIENNLCIIDHYGKMAVLVNDPANQHGLSFITVSSNVPDSYFRRMSSFLYDSISHSITGLGENGTTHSIAPYAAGQLGLNYTTFETPKSIGQQLVTDGATRQIDYSTVWLQMSTAQSNISKITISPSRDVSFSNSTALKIPISYATLPTNSPSLNRIDKIDNTYYMITYDGSSFGIISTTDWITFNKVMYTSYSGENSAKYGLLKSSNGDYLIISSRYNNFKCIRESSNIQDPNSFSNSTTSTPYSALNSALLADGPFYRYYSDHVYSSSTNRYVILSASQPNDDANQIGASKVTIANSDLKTGIQSKGNTTYGRSCIASDNLYWYCGALGGIYRGDFNNPNSDEVYIRIEAMPTTGKVVSINTQKAGTLLALIAETNTVHYVMTSTDAGLTWGNKIYMPSEYRILPFLYGYDIIKNILVYDEASSAYYVVFGDWTIRYMNTIYKISLDGSPPQKFSGCRAYVSSGMISHNGALYFASGGGLVEVKTV